MRSRPSSRRIRRLVVSLVVVGTTAYGTAAQAAVAPEWNHDPATQRVDR